MTEPFDVNTASVESLCARFPNLGLFVAEDIVAWREKNGPFASAESLSEVTGDPELALSLGEQFSRPSESPSADTDLAPPPAEPAFPEEVQISETPIPTAAATLPESLAPSAPRLSSTPPASVSPASPSRDVEPRVRRIGVQTIALAMLVMANVGLAAGLTSLREDEQRARVPVAAMSSEVQRLRTTQSDTATQLDGAHSRLDDHDAKLAKVTQTLETYGVGQREAERVAKERDERAARDLAAVNARVGNLERTADINVHTLDEVLTIVNLTATPEAPPEGSAAPAHSR